MKNKIVFSVLVFLTLFGVVRTASADTSITLDIETPTGALINKSITVTPCDSDNDASTPDTISAYCAVLQSGLTNDWSWFGSDAFLNSIGTYVNNDNSNNIYWSYFDNLNYGQVALNKYILNSGDNILLNYGIDPLKISVDKTAPSVGNSIIITVLQFGYDSSWNPVWSPATTGKVVIGTNTFNLNPDGTYTYKIPDITAFSVKAQEVGFLDTNSINITPTPAQEEVIIKNGSTVIYNGLSDLPPAGTVQIPDKNGTNHDVNADSVLNIIYSLDQVNSNFSISDLEYNNSYNSFYLKCLTPTGGTNLCDNWQYVVDGSYPSVGMGKDVLSGGEKIYLYFGPQNKVSLDKTTMDTSQTLNVTALKYDYINNAWLNRTGVTIGVTKPDPKNPYSPDDSIQAPVDSSTAIATFSNIPAGTYNVGVKEDYYWPTVELTVNNVVVPIVSSGGGTSTATRIAKKNFSVPEALKFLSLNQKADGSFNSSLYTDWVAIALSHAGDKASLMKTKIYNYLINEDFTSSSVTDNEREAMTLMALDINPYSGTKTNYIKKIIASFDGQQIGDKNLFNDDIFGLVVLAKAGYIESDNVISKTVNFVISKQQSNGSWGSVDMTAAAIQALTNFKEISKVSDSISRGLNYLSGVQSSDGGFNNSFATSWAAQAFSTDNLFKVQAEKAVGYLTREQQSDGGVDDITNPTNSRVWATAYAIPATLYLPWGKVLNSFPKPVTIVSKSSITTNNKITKVVSPTIAIVIPPKIKKKSILPVIVKKVKAQTQVQTKNIIATKISTNKLLKVIPSNLNNSNVLLGSASSSSAVKSLSGKKIIMFISSISLVIFWGFVLGL